MYRQYQRISTSDFINVHDIRIFSDKTNDKNQSGRGEAQSWVFSIKSNTWYGKIIRIDERNNKLNCKSKKSPNGRATEQNIGRVFVKKFFKKDLYFI